MCYWWTPTGCAVGALIDTGIVIGAGDTGSKIGKLLKDYIDNKNNTNNNTNTTTNNTSNDKNITAANSPNPMLLNGDDNKNDKNDKNEKNKTNDRRWSNENPKYLENDVEIFLVIKI